MVCLIQFNKIELIDTVDLNYKTELSIKEEWAKENNENDQGELFVARQKPNQL